MRAAWMVVWIVGGCSDPCSGPLGDQEESVATFSRAVEVAREHAKQACSGYWEWRIDIGTCGSFSYISEGDGFVGVTRYYDEDGNLVGAIDGGDQEGPDGCFDHTAGHVPDCTHVPTERLCPSP
jgi:hypothetical protein